MSEVYNKRLLEVLNLVAATADVQISAFPDFVHIPDEVASEIADVIEYAPEELENKEKSIIKVLTQIDRIFLKYAGQKDFWTMKSMRNCSVWNDIRLLAREELKSLGISESVPNLFWLQYVQ